MPLTTEIIEKARPGITPQNKVTNRPYKIYDSAGLFLLVAQSGGKWWRLKYQFGGKEKQVSLGTYPKISLGEARKHRDELKALLASGVDPSTHLKLEKAAKQAEQRKTIKAARFTLDNKGSLSFKLGQRCLTLTPSETTELRTFLDATRDVKPCH